MKHYRRTLSLVAVWILVALLPLSAENTKKAKKRARISDYVNLSYSLQPGDILSYAQVFEVNNELLDDSSVRYGARLEWQIKLAVLSRDGNISHVVAQYNKTKTEIQNRPELEKKLGRKKTEDLLAPFEQSEEITVRYLVMDELGNILNHSYSVNDTVSCVVSSMLRLFHLPGIPLWAGSSYSVNEELALEVLYSGETMDNGRPFHAFTGSHPSGRVQMFIDKELGVPAKLEYESSYIATGQKRWERNIVLFGEKKRIAWNEAWSDKTLNRALVLGALSRTELVCDREVIRSFLESDQVLSQNLSAAYCGLRGLPAGLDSKPLLKAKNPLIRFNTAKAVFKETGDAAPMTALQNDSDPAIRRRAANFLERSTYLLPADRHPQYAALQSWFYTGGPVPTDVLEDMASLHKILNFLKPQNDHIFGVYKNFIPDETGQDNLLHPYYIRLPEDYDPSEVYPMLVYLGVGDGRADYAFGSIYHGLRKIRRLSNYILLVPQAHGKWWEASQEGVIRTVLSSVKKSYSIDSNQVFLAGSSNGGMGTIFFGTRLADSFAGLASNMGYPVVDRLFLNQPQNLSLLKNLLNSKIFLSHGAADDVVTPEGDRLAFDLLKKNGAQVVYKEISDKKHDIEIQEVLGRIIHVFENWKRNPYPKSLEFITEDPGYMKSYWLEIVEYGSLPATVKAVVRGNTIEIESSGVRRLQFFLDEKLVDLSKEIIIRIRGKDAFRGIVKSSSDAILLSVKKAEDALLSYCASVEIDLDDLESPA